MRSLFIGLVVMVAQERVSANPDGLARIAGWSGFGSLVRRNEDGILL